MPKSNRSIMAKADMEVADLIADGGYLQSEQAESFVVDLIKESVLMQLVTVQGLKSHTKLIDKVGINGRVLRPGTSGHALAVADRTKPTTAQVTLSTHLMKAELRLNDELLEDNIENGSFKTT
ncbi:MAG: phage major capsid protein, partial [Thermotogota bacterium]